MVESMARNDLASDAEVQAALYPLLSHVKNLQPLSSESEAGHILYLPATSDTCSDTSTSECTVLQGLKEYTDTCTEIDESLQGTTDALKVVRDAASSLETCI